MSTPQRRTLRYKRVGPCVIGADAFVPPGPGPHPLIVWIHGGGLIVGSRRDIPGFHLDRYLGAGFAVLAIDYRLAPETKLPLIVSDVADAFEWARTTGTGVFDIDPARIGVVGHSAGGYLALWAAAALRPRPKAVVAFYGYGDIIPDWYREPSPHYLGLGLISERDARAGVCDRVISTSRAEGRARFYDYCRQQGSWPREVVGPAALDDPDGVTWLRPVRLVSAAFPPTLLIHGEDDTDVPFSASTEMASELRSHGVEHELMAIKERDHVFDEDRSDPMTTMALDRAVAFLIEHLG